MRDIKFRAWHKSEKKIYRVLSLVLGQREQEVTLVRYEGPYVTCPLSEVILLQYTSLTDKNRKEIYKGDICYCEDSWYKTYEVYWNDDRWGLRRKYSDYDNGDYYHGSDINWNEFEVIGNIYENPELLSTEQK